MSQTAITLAFEQHLAELQLGGQPVVPDEFVLAYIPGLDLLAPINRAAGLPPAGQIVHRQPVDQRGKVNANGVAYSIIMDTRVGDFTFNAMYLVHKASGMVAMVVHKADEDKLANKGDTQPGNSLVKSMLMEYQGAAEATNTQVDAGTWQIDFTARLLGLDEDIRLQALDHYGDAAFIDGGFAVTPGQGVNEFIVAPGLGYIAGLRARLASQQSVVVAQRPATLYADVYHAGTLLSDWHTHVEIKASSTPLTDYTDGAGYPHYVVPIASLAANGVVTDLRGRGGLWWHEHRPQAHTKAQVGLDKLENWSWSHSYTDATGGATKYASGKAVADAYNALNSSKLDKTSYGTTETKGILELADSSEAIGGIDNERAMTSARVHEAFNKFGLGSAPVATGYDFNSAATKGFSSFLVVNGLNAASGFSGSGFILSLGSEGASYQSQLAFDYNQQEIYYRRRKTDSWVKLYHSGNDGANSDLDADKLDGKQGGYYLEWGNLTGKPEVYPPSSHSHSWENITGKPSNIAGDPGQVAAFATATPPAGWLKANGAAVSRVTYAALFAAIGTTFGDGDSSTTFNLPDLRGEFVRGVDDGRGIDIGRTMGSEQTDEFRAHKHMSGLSEDSSQAFYGVSETGLSGKSLITNGTAQSTSSPNTSTVGGNETRPRNVALLYCIKY